MSIRSTLYIILFVSIISYNASLESIHPDLTVIVVVDQCAYNYFDIIRPYVTGGLFKLLNNGVIYTRAYMPHGVPTTGPGHATLSTGTWPSEHGIVSNSWFKGQGVRISCDTDNAAYAATFKPNGTTYPQGKSCSNLMVDTLSDQFYLRYPQSKPLAISVKGRASVMCAGKMGIGVWFDERTGTFTTSRAYTPTLPTWIRQFNNSITQTVGSYVWKPTYAENHAAYKNTNSDYTWTSYKKLIGTQITAADISRKPRDILLATPYATQLTLDCAYAALVDRYKIKSKDPLLVWICISTLDKTGHAYGPESKESLDVLYQLDRQLGEFMGKVEKLIPASNTLYVLTADHGICPIPEQMRQKGYPAYRVDKHALIKDLTRLATTEFALEKPIIKSNKVQFYIDQKSIETLKKRGALDDFYQRCIEVIQAYPGIKKVWTYSELMHISSKPTLREQWLIHQLFKDRSGQLIAQTYPYSFISSYDKGTSHTMPYDYDTHIPLILYWPGQLQHTYINSNVTVLQLAPTLARLMGCASPSCAQAHLLPGIFQNTSL